MRIPFPERIPLNRAGLFAIVLFVIQRLEGTAFYFSLGCAAFILIATVAFNAAGGLTRASGAYVFFYSVLVVIIGICYKAVLGEPGQSNLLAPRKTIEIYVASISMMFAAVVVSRRLARKSGVLQGMLKDSQMYRSSVGCIAFGALGGFALTLFGQSGERLQTAFAQLNELIPLGIIIGVMYEIRRSGGTRSTNTTTIAAAAYFFVFYGALNFSKQGLLLPLYCWILPICALRFRLSVWQTLGCLLGVFVVFYYLTPFAQFGRIQIPEFPTFSQRVEVATKLLEHPDETRRAYNQEMESLDGPSGLNAYYDKPQGFWERLQFVSADDRLIDATDRGSVFGLLPVAYEFSNAIPHIFWPNKPGGNYGNMYTHDINGTSRDEGDTTTGVSFSPSGEAYHLAEWTGILLVAPLIWCMLFTVWDSLLGDLRDSPWGFLAIALLSHNAPEGGITTAIHLTTFGSEILIFCAVFATWVAPVLASAVLGPERHILPANPQPDLPIGSES